MRTGSWDIMRSMQLPNTTATSSFKLFPATAPHLTASAGPCCPTHHPSPDPYSLSSLRKVALIKPSTPGRLFHRPQGLSVEPMQDDKQSPLMQIAPRMLATEQKPCLREFEWNVLFLHSSSGDADNLAETAQVVFLLLFWQRSVQIWIPPLCQD